MDFPSPHGLVRRVHWAWLDLKYCPNANCPHRLTSGSQAEYLDRVVVCADCGAELVAAPGSVVAVSQALAPGEGATESDEDAGDAQARRARSDVQVGVFGILAGAVITFGTMMFPNEQGTYLFAWGPIAYGVYRLMRGMG